MRARARIVAEGDVQKAGYRDIVEDIAVKLGVKGFVENLRDKTVCVVCEGEKDVVDRFVDAIKIKNDIVDVKSVKIVETSPATNEFEYFDIKYGSPEEELGERMVAAVKYAKLALHETRGVGGKVDGVADEIKGSREDIKGIRDEVKASRGDIKEMHQDMNKSFSQLNDNMNKNFGQLNETIGTKFESMDVKYGDISKTMREMHNDLREMKNLFAKLVNHFVKE